MNRKYRKTIIAGNWKMHKTATETKRFAERLKGALPRSKRCSIVLCVPYVDIPAAVKLLKDSRVAVGAQNLHWEASGPFTGEISAAMLADLDVKYVIIGHSERRAHFGESDLIINKKIHAALAAGLRPILCVGEDLAQRQLGVTLEFITYQLKAALAGVSPEAMRRVVIAYEPIWAIGTGNTATPEQAGEVCAAIRRAAQALWRPDRPVHHHSVRRLHERDQCGSPSPPGGCGWRSHRHRRPGPGKIPPNHSDRQPRLTRHWPGAPAPGSEGKVL